MGKAPTNLKSFQVTKYNNKRVRSGKTGLEREHVVPKAALKLAGLNLKTYYNRAPTIAIHKLIHRGGVRGGVGGGGISSTGSGRVSKGWAVRMAHVIKTHGYASGLKMGLIDNINALRVNNALTPRAIQGYTTYVDAQRSSGLINQDEANILRFHVQDMGKST